MYFAPSRTKAASVPAMIVSLAEVLPLKVIVFVIDEPLISPRYDDVENEPLWNSKVTAPPIPQTFNVLVTLSKVAKSPVGPTEYVPAAKGPVHSVWNVNGPSQVLLQQFCT